MRAVNIFSFFKAITQKLTHRSNTMNHVTVDSIKFTAKAAWNHQHNAFMSQRVSILCCLEKVKQHEIFSQSHRMFLSKILMVVVMWMPFGRKESNVIGSLGKHVAFKPWLYCFWILLLMLFITTLFKSYSLLDIINFVFLLYVFETKLHLPRPIIHKILIGSEKREELHLCFFFSFSSKSLLSEPASARLIYNTSIVSALDIHNQFTQCFSHKVIQPFVRIKVLPKIANWVPAPTSTVNQVWRELALDSSANPVAPFWVKWTNFRCFLKVGIIKFLLFHIKMLSLTVFP